MSEHECVQETPIALLKAEECTMQKKIERMEEHIEGSPGRHQELKDAISALRLELKGDISGIKIWVLGGVAGSLFTVIISAVFK